MARKTRIVPTEPLRFPWNGLSEEETRLFDEWYNLEMKQGSKWIHVGGRRDDRKWIKEVFASPMRTAFKKHYLVGLLSPDGPYTGISLADLTPELRDFVQEVIVWWVDHGRSCRAYNAYLLKLIEIRKKGPLAEQAFEHFDPLGDAFHYGDSAHMDGEGINMAWPFAGAITAFIEAPIPRVWKLKAEEKMRHEVQAVCAGKDHSYQYHPLYAYENFCLHRAMEKDIFTTQELAIMATEVTNHDTSTISDYSKRKSRDGGFCPSLWRRFNRRPAREHYLPLRLAITRFMAKRLAREDGQYASAAEVSNVKQMAAELDPEQDAETIEILNHWITRAEADLSARARSKVQQADEERAAAERLGELFIAMS